MIVIDASAAIAAALTEGGLGILDAERLVAPHLLASEASSALHEAAWRGDLDPQIARRALGHLVGARIDLRTARGPEPAWAVADELGWAKTYDAEYVALARELDCLLLTVDERLRRGASRLIRVITPADLQA